MLAVPPSEPSPHLARPRRASASPWIGPIPEGAWPKRGTEKTGTPGGRPWRGPPPAVHPPAPPPEGVRHRAPGEKEVGRQDAMTVNALERREGRRPVTIR